MLFCILKSVLQGNMVVEMLHLTFMIDYARAIKQIKSAVTAYTLHCRLQFPQYKASIIYSIVYIYVEGLLYV